jgi:hypothetical protein
MTDRDVARIATIMRRHQETVRLLRRRVKKWKGRAVAAENELRANALAGWLWKA